MVRWIRLTKKTGLARMQDDFGKGWVQGRVRRPQGPTGGGRAVPGRRVGAGGQGPLLPDSPAGFLGYLKISGQRVGSTRFFHVQIPGVRR